MATIVEAMISGAVIVSFSPSWLVTVERVSAERAEVAGEDAAHPLEVLGDAAAG